MPSPLPLPGLRFRALPLVAATLAASAALVPPPGGASSLFAAAEVDLRSFVLVAAPIGSGPRSQLNIYEQVKATRPCFAVGEGKPAAVNPLLATFDFTGICSRYIDANGYSLRVGGSDLATSYRLMVSRDSDDTLLLAIPTRSGAGPEMVVARTQGLGSGFLQLHLEPGWTLKRRQFGGRRLGHVYIYRENWPGAASTAAVPGAADDAGPDAAEAAEARPIALPVTP